MIHDRIGIVKKRDLVIAVKLIFMHRTYVNDSFESDFVTVDNLFIYLSINTTLIISCES